MQGDEQLLIRNMSFSKKKKKNVNVPLINNYGTWLQLTETRNTNTSATVANLIYTQIPSNVQHLFKRYKIRYLFQNKTENNGQAEAGVALVRINRQASGLE